MEIFKIEHEGRIYECPIGASTDSMIQERNQIWCKMLQLALAKTKFPNGDQVILSKTKWGQKVNWRVNASKTTKSVKPGNDWPEVLDDAAIFLESHGVKYWEFEAAETK